MELRNSFSFAFFAGVGYLLSLFFLFLFLEEVKFY